MSFRQKLKDEIAAMGIAMLYFGCWIATLLLIKALVLAEYQIVFHEWSLAVVGALILSKVVLVLEHVSLGKWVRAQPAWVDVVLRTIMYSLGIAVVLVLEKGFEGRHEHGGFGPALRHLFLQEDVHRVWANIVCLTSALLGYNVFSAIQRHFGEGALAQVFLSPLPEEKKTRQQITK